MPHIFLLSLFLVFSSLHLGAQSPYKNILLDKDQTGYPPSEPSITINPKDPDNIVAGAILNRAYFTRDGGKSWRKVRLRSQYGVYGDPCLVADDKGRIYYLHLSNPKGYGDQLLDRIVCQRSDDGGARWNSGSYMGYSHPKDQDKEWAIAEPKKSRLYATWTQFDEYESTRPEDKSNILFSRSKNKAKKWSEAIQINTISGDCLDNDETAEGAVPAAGPKGEVYVAWALNEKIYFNRSLNKGKSWWPSEREIAQQPEGWTIDIPGIFRANGMPVTLCDLSDGPRRGAVYVHWADQRNGTTDTDLWVIRSDDRGETWTEPVRINQDAPGNQQFFSWMTVDQTTGYLYVVFYDRRHYDDNNTDVFLAWSTDGGETWQDRRISKEPFYPDSRVFFGDYNNIAAYGGRICPIWTRMDQGQTSIWTAILEHEELEKDE